MRPFRFASVFVLALAVCAVACHASPPPAVPAALVRDAPFTVFVFFAARCPCQAAHDARLAALYARFHPRGVAFYAVDSEVTATSASDAAEAKRRAYPYPILTDEGAHLAASLDAEYATYTAVVDRAGRVRYRGGIDSDKSHLREHPKTYLADALDDLVAGRDPRRAEAKTLGCALTLE